MTKCDHQVEKINKMFGSEVEYRCKVCKHRVGVVDESVYVKKTFR